MLQISKRKLIRIKLHVFRIFIFWNTEKSTEEQREGTKTKLIIIIQLIFTKREEGKAGFSRGWEGVPGGGGSRSKRGEDSRVSKKGMRKLAGWYWQEGRSGGWIMLGGGMVGLC